MAIRQHWIHGMSTPGNGTEAAAHPIDKAIVNLTKVQTRSMTSKGKKREYELERVVAKRTHKTKGGKIKTQYLVKWLGFEDHENTWLDDKDLEQAQELINEYENRQAATTS
ncbi:protein CHROMATIN REMODELING 5 [Aspergillus lentulus]|nr:protein CHROMATIN REMODELING 5 [Aspergillus lentulus]